MSIGCFWTGFIPVPSSGATGQIDRSQICFKFLVFYAEITLALHEMVQHKLCLALCPPIRALELIANTFI